MSSLKTALDFYDRGKQKESNADDYDSRMYYSKGRFICPECGEAVYIRSSKYSNFFVHYKKTDISDNCDRRIDGISTDSIYERIGMPIYIRKDKSNSFSLYMGFRVLPNNLLKKAEENKATICFDGKRRYSISRERFSVEETTMLPIQRLLSAGSKYYLQISPQNIQTAVSPYWPNYADGFQYEGALFTVTGRGGKKIRQGDNIATETEYYWVRRQKELPSSSLYRGMHMEYVGTITLDDITLYVFKGFFESDIQDYEFYKLALFLRNALRVHLLEKLPEIYPIWPPLIKQEEGYLYQPNIKKIYSRVISGNDVPKTYLYRGISPNPEILTNIEGCTEIYTRQNDITINIDRKYTSNGSVFICCTFKYNSVESEYNYYQQGNKLVISGLDSKIIYYIKVDGTIEKIKGVLHYEITDFGKKDIVIITSHRCVIDRIIYNLNEIVETSNFDEKELLIRLRKYKTQKLVNLPYQLRKRLKKFDCTDDELLREVSLLLRTNKITNPAIRVIEEVLNGKY